MLTDVERIRTLDARAVRLSIDVLRQAEPADLGRDTPCAGWDLGDLLAHMTVQHEGFAAAAAGEGGDLAHWAVRPLGAEPFAAYEAAAGAVVAAFAAVEAEEQPFVLPEFTRDRTFPAAQAIGFHFLDYVVHAWDVAATLGVPFGPDQDLVEAVLPLALSVPTGRARTVPGAAFRPPLPPPPGEDPLPVVLSALGRAPLHHPRGPAHSAG